MTKNLFLGLISELGVFSLGLDFFIMLKVYSLLNDPSVKLVEK